MSLVLTVEDIRKTYNGNEVFSGFSLTFEHARVFSLMGPNGSGKSTFLRLCALLEEPDSGSVKFFDGDRESAKDITLKRRITLVLPKGGIFNATVFDNISYGLKIRGVAKDEIRKRTARYLETFGLMEKKEQNALALSSGEAQRLCIARAMAIEPDLLFLDEPTASVDEKNSRIIEEIIIGMKEQGNPAVIMTTHDPAQAKRLSDRQFVIREKKIVLQN